MPSVASASSAAMPSRRFASDERVATQVLVDVPHPAPFVLRCGRQEPRAAVAELERRQPTLHDEAVGVRNRRGVALEHERAAGATAETKSVDTLLQTLETDGVFRGCSAVQQAL